MGWEESEEACSMQVGDYICMQPECDLPCCLFVCPFLFILRKLVSSWTRSSPFWENLDSPHDSPVSPSKFLASEYMKLLPELSFECCMFKFRPSCLQRKWANFKFHKLFIAGTGRYSTVNTYFDASLAVYPSVYTGNWVWQIW